MLQVSLYSSIPALTIHILFRLLRWDTRSELALHSGYCTKLTPHPLRHYPFLCLYLTMVSIEALLIGIHWLLWFHCTLVTTLLAMTWYGRLIAVHLL
jgi:hypothetical protein